MKLHTSQKHPYFFTFLLFYTYQEHVESDKVSIQERSEEVGLKRSEGGEACGRVEVRPLDHHRLAMTKRIKRVPPVVRTGPGIPNSPKRQTSVQHLEQKVNGEKVNGKKVNGAKRQREERQGKCRGTCCIGLRWERREGMFTSPHGSSMRGWGGIFSEQCGYHF